MIVCIGGGIARSAGFLSKLLGPGLSSSTHLIPKIDTVLPPVSAQDVTEAAGSTLNFIIKDGVCNALNS